MTYGSEVDSSTFTLALRTQQFQHDSTMKPTLPQDGSGSILDPVRAGFAYIG